MQHWHLYFKWNSRLFGERYQAYQKSGRGPESCEEDPSLNWYEGELKFFDHYVIPLAKKLQECRVFGVAADEYLDYAIANRDEWHRKGHDAVKQMVAQYVK